MAAFAPDPRAEEVLERHSREGTGRRRGWVVRRALLTADVLGLAAAFAVAQFAFGPDGDQGVSRFYESLLFLATLPGWIVVAKLYELYDHDEERTEHTTVDDLRGVFHLVTVGAWLFFVASWSTGLADPVLARLVTFWLLAIALVCLGRATARTFCRRSLAYLQNTVIVGAGEVGQLVARKLVQHPEYGINVVGFVDAEPAERRAEVEHIAYLGPTDRLPELVGLLDVERVVVAFSRDSQERMTELVRSLQGLDLQIDIVPRLYEVVGPNVAVHAVEGIPLIGLPSSKLFPLSKTMKRCGDIVGAAVALVLLAPLFAFIAWRIKHDSPGPVFFRQTRLGKDMREFTALKFRTMKVGTDTEAHRDFIRRTMKASAQTNGNGLYKLDRSDAVTTVGGWLRRTSLDELPQLLNVLRGDMSLVGPRPCIAYETENFEPHHFERFKVPAGLTGLWQVTARAHSTFGEALEMDVAYARNWSLGLDLLLLLKTPFQVFRQKRATA